MEFSAIARRSLAVVTLLGVCLLSGCMFAAGKFTSTLDIRRDGQFTFAYQGEIHVLALSDFAVKNSNQPKLSPPRCYDSDHADTQIERNCTPEEIARQKNQWQQQQSAADAKRKRDAEQMRGALGGIDPNDPRAAEELARKLRRQTGFRSVTYQGNGLYLVDFALAGNLTHDFSFPSVEGFPMNNAFVEIGLRNDGTVRIDAPGFVASSAGHPASALLAGAVPGGGSEDIGPRMPVLDGVFTLTTDAPILSNNTDEGSQTAPDGHRLTWNINSRTGVPPMALIRLDR